MKFKNIRKLIANWIYPETTPNILDAQMKYIQMLQDCLSSCYVQLTDMLQPVIESNKILQAKLVANRTDDLNVQSK